MVNDSAGGCMIEQVNYAKNIFGVVFFQMCDKMLVCVGRNETRKVHIFICDLPVLTELRNMLVWMFIVA